jgi:crotonobetainyl-CoA:carnitine CoA-transferase CaiB-like acyl-CoA transferase
MAAGQTPLEGLRVVELARILAGSWMGQTLADLGADVVKVECTTGEDTRRWGPPYVKGSDGSDPERVESHGGAIPGSLRTVSWDPQISLNKGSER